MPFSDRRVNDVLAFLKAFMYQLLQSFYSKYHSLKPIYNAFSVSVSHGLSIYTVPFNNKIPYFAVRSVLIQSPWAFHHDITSI